jgi:transcriptional regulator with XRE-family HTH domain
MNIGQRLYELRAAKSFSQGDIEKRSGLLRCYISRVENGHTIPSLETLEKFAGALEIELYQLFFEGEGKPATPLPKKTTGLDVEERALFDTFRKLNKKDQRLAVGMIGKMARTGQSAK